MIDAALAFFQLVKQLEIISSEYSKIRAKLVDKDHNELICIDSFSVDGNMQNREV